MTKLPLAAALFFLASACGGADPPNDLLGRRASQPGSSGDPQAASDGDETGASTSEDGGAGTGQGDGADAGGGVDSGGVTPSNAFTGANAYVAQNGPSTIKGDHGGDGNPAKKSCLDGQCHGQGGEGPRFIAGGTVFSDLAGTMPAAQIEVRIRDAAGNASLARTDTNGNFFVRASNGNVTFPAQTAARDATNTRPMVASIANGDCNSSSCHGGAQGFIHVP